MRDGKHHFRVGAFDCSIVSDGTYSYPHPGKLLFPDAPRDQLEQALREWNIELAAWDTYVSPYPSLLVNTGSQNILVDTGAGSFGPSTGQLVANLGAIGLAASDVDMVILTHAHPDHIGGVLDAQGRPAFSKARHLISQTEWDFWMNSPDLSSLRVPDEFKAALRNCASTNLPPLGELIEFVGPETEVAQGIQVLDAAGHTPGQIGIRFCSENQILFAIADVVVHPVHVSHPEWSTAVDCSPEISVLTRQRILSQAAEEDALVFAYHFPSPGVGYVEAVGDSWQWRDNRRFSAKGAV